MVCCLEVEPARACLLTSVVVVVVVDVVVVDVVVVVDTIRAPILSSGKSSEGLPVTMLCYLEVDLAMACLLTLVVVVVDTLCARI